MFKPCSRVLGRPPLSPAIFSVVLAEEGVGGQHFRLAWKVKVLQLPHVARGREVSCIAEGSDSRGLTHSFPE